MGSSWLHVEERVTPIIVYNSHVVKIRLMKDFPDHLHLMDLSCFSVNHLRDTASQ
jgi:hypothetical protein